MDTHITPPPFLFVYCVLSMFFVKDVESTSGSGPESFYTPEPSPTDRDSDSSGELCSREFTFVFVQCMYVCVLLCVLLTCLNFCLSGKASERQYSGI